MNTQSEYPKHMAHPGYQRGTVKEIPGVDAVSGRKFVDYQGTPDRYPPVDVINEDIEAQYRAKGYLAFGEAAGGCTAYREYPKMLVHPQHEPATQTIAAVLNGGNQVISPEIPGRPAKFPDISVSNPEEETSAVARGYLAPGKPDPAAVQAAISSPYDPDRVTQEYPKVVNGNVVQEPGYDPHGRQEYPKWINLPDHPHGGKEVASLDEEEKLTGKVSAPRAPKPAATETKFERAQRLKAEAEAALREAEDEEPDGAAETPTATPVAVKNPANEGPMINRKAIYAELDKRGIAYSKHTPTPKLMDLLKQQAA